MKNSDLDKKLKSLSTLPALKRSNKDMSFIDAYSDDKIHDICEACYNIVHMVNLLQEEHPTKKMLLCSLE